eukprot:3393993-Rhodomonas_salina.1
MTVTHDDDQPEGHCCQPLSRLPPRHSVTARAAGPGPGACGRRRAAKYRDPVPESWHSESEYNPPGRVPGRGTMTRTPPSTATGGSGRTIQCTQGWPGQLAPGY